MSYQKDLDAELNFIKSRSGQNIIKNTNSSNTSNVNVTPTQNNFSVTGTSKFANQYATKSPKDFNDSLNDRSHQEPVVTKLLNLNERNSNSYSN